jgi:hypothetical protein
MEGAIYSGKLCATEIAKDWNSKTQLPARLFADKELQVAESS